MYNAYYISHSILLYVYFIGIKSEKYFVTNIVCVDKKKYLFDFKVFDLKKYIGKNPYHEF